MKRSYNRNILKDALIGSCSCNIQQIVVNRGHLDTHLPIVSNGKNHGTLHVCIDIPEGRFYFYFLVIF